MSALRIWGCPVWVHYANGSKLGVCACKACWLGLNIDAKAHHVYWPGPGNVTVERNVYFGTSAPLKGEDESEPTTSNEQADIPHILSLPEEPDTPSTIKVSTPAPDDEPEEHEKPLTQLRRSMHIQKPSRIMHDLQAGEGVTSTRSASPQIIPSLQMPGSLAEEVVEAGGVWTAVDGAPALLEDFDGLEHVFMVETADSEALKPHTLAEAKRRPDWLLWEKAIQEELATLKATGT